MIGSGSIRIEGVRRFYRSIRSAWIWWASCTRFYSFGFPMWRCSWSIYRYLARLFRWACSPKVLNSAWRCWSCCCCSMNSDWWSCSMLSMQLGSAGITVARCLKWIAMQCPSGIESGLKGILGRSSLSMMNRIQSLSTRSSSIKSMRDSHGSLWRMSGFSCPSTGG